MKGGWATDYESAHPPRRGVQMSGGAAKSNLYQDQYNNNPTMKKKKKYPPHPTPPNVTPMSTFIAA